jgi:hypothetical protein
MNIIRPILIVAGAIVAAAILWTVITFVTALLFKLVTFAILIGILYVVFLVARSALRKPSPR